MDFTYLLKTFAAYRRSVLRNMHPASTQEGELLKLIRHAENTKFGTDHGFKGIQSVEEYQSRVPIRPYEKFWEEYWKDQYPVINNSTWPGTIPYFPLSSGTSSGTTKYIPLTKEMIASNNKAGLDLLVHHVSNCPTSRILGGKSFMLGGSTDLNEVSPGIFAGDLSGISVRALPWWARLRYFPPEELALIKDWEQKIEIIGRKSLEEDIRMISGVPSWMLIFFDKLAAMKGDKETLLSSLFPNLEMLVHGGVSFAPYQKQFKELLKGSKAELREVYPASEGFIATADRGSGEGLRMNLDHGIFYEFIPLEELDSPSPTRHWIKNVELDVNYAIVLTTCAGVWSYLLGDTVRFIDRSPPRLLVTGRTKYYLSAFGEHLIAEEIEDAVAYASESISAFVDDFTVGPVFPANPNDLGGHIFFIEFENPPSPDALQVFSKKLDERLCERNEDYAAHRANGFGLKDPQIIPLRHGKFAAWMKSRGKLGGQNKVPRIITDLSLLDNLRSFVETN